LAATRLLDVSLVHFNVLNRRVHYWVAFAAAIPLLVIIASGVLLQSKKQWDWVQPPEHRGSGTEPRVGLDGILAAVQSVPELGVTSWDDVDRLDVRPGRGLVKVLLKNRWEAQVDLGTGRVMQTAYRRSDLIESIHDGSYFAGDWTKLGLFLPAALVLFLLWLSGLWMVWVPWIAKRRRRHRHRPRAAAAVLLLTLPAAAFAAQRLAIDPIVGHWEVMDEGGETVVLADARKWKAEPAATPFPLALIRGVENFSEGVLTVKFKMIAGASDQIAGLAFGATGGRYYYARYNTKDGNVALWEFEGDRKRLVDGTAHLQLPLNVWHELRVEIRGARVAASVNDRLRIEHTLPEPVTGRVGFYTKRDSVTAFKDFSVRPLR
jgi:hypothetical protein